MKIGIWSDCHNFPSLPAMKLSAYHKSIGDEVELFDRWNHYDLVYASKVFSWTDDIDLYPVFADEIRKGGSGYCITVEDGKEIFDESKNTPLPKEIEHIYPDYSLYPQYTYATGFLTRGCPRGCEFCIVARKEGKRSVQVADLSEFWRGQKEIKLLDPNLIACKDHERLLQELADSKATIDFTQGLDIRLLTADNIKLLNKVKAKNLHFAWDNPKDDLEKYFKRYFELGKIKNHRRLIVYCLTNFNSTFEEDLYRVETLRRLGYDPYVMIYQKETAGPDVRRLQRWCNNRFIFGSCEFKDYKG